MKPIAKERRKIYGIVYNTARFGYVAKPKFQGGVASVPADLKEAYVNNYKIVIQEYICYHVGN
jgi:hypothetical protein